LVALAPDVILVNGPADLAQVQQATRSLLQDPTLTSSVAQFAAIQSAAASIGVELSPIDMRNRARSRGSRTAPFSGIS
jgi:hypothetical protein